MKAKYFPRCNLLEATGGEKASGMWRGIIQALPTISAHSHWSIVNGQDVDIFRDRWVLGSQSRIIKPSTWDSDLHFVAQLIDPETQEWKMETISAAFDTHTAESINRTPIDCNNPGGKDLLVWEPTKDGRFTTRSCYNLLRPIETDTHRGPMDMRETMSRVWKHKDIMPRIKHFAWRMATECLPMRDFLSRFNNRVLASPPLSLNDRVGLVAQSV